MVVHVYCVQTRPVGWSESSLVHLHRNRVCLSGFWCPHCHPPIDLSERQYLIREQHLRVRRRVKEFWMGR